MSNWKNSDLLSLGTGLEFGLEQIVETKTFGYVTHDI